MKLFRISQTVHRGWDTYSDAVVIAKDSESAARIHPDRARDEPWPFVETDEDWRYPRQDWADSPDQVKVEYLGEAAETFTEEQVVCHSFHAG